MRRFDKPRTGGIARVLALASPGAVTADPTAAQPLVLHLSTTAPHRLLRLEVTGTPLEQVRMNASGS